MLGVYSEKYRYYIEEVNKSHSEYLYINRRMSDSPFGFFSETTRPITLRFCMKFPLIYEVVLK